MHGFDCRWDKPQQQYQKRLLRPEVQSHLSPQLRRLLALDDAQKRCAELRGRGTKRVYEVKVFTWAAART
jgi:hypothetical protein